MTEIEKTVFISYRRKVSWAFARLVFDDLVRHRYDVFMDVETLDSGTFDTIILNQIAARAHFLVVLAPGSLERCNEPGDWLRREIEHAMDLQRNIVPVLIDGFDFGQCERYLTGKLKELKRYNGLPLSHDFFDAAMERLRTRFLKQPVYGAIQPTPTAEQPLVEQRIAEVIRTPALPATPVGAGFKPVPMPIAGRDPILDVLPPPFEWCAIPAGRVMLEKNAGTFKVKPFKMAKYPITYAQFQVFIDVKDGFYNLEWWTELAAKAEQKKQPDEQQWQDDDRPREHVSWYDAVAFTLWLSHKVGYEVRLPTELEWQWAAQGPKGHRYPWRGDFDEKKCNTAEGRNGQTTVVDRYPAGASPFGVMDMVGNVWEWCLNNYSKPGDKDIKGTDARVIRGGSWNSNFSVAHATRRSTYNPYARNDIIGFRVVRSDSPK